MKKYYVQVVFEIEAEDLGELEKKFKSISLKEFQEKARIINIK